MSGSGERGRELILYVNFTKPPGCCVEKPSEAVRESVQVEADGGLADRKRSVNHSCWNRYCFSIR